MKTKKFPLADVLSMTTGKLLAPIGNLYKVVGYISGADGNVWTHELPGLSKKYKPYILEKYPELKNVNADNVNRDNWKEFLNEQIEKYGKELVIPRIGKGRKEIENPIISLGKMMNGGKNES